MSVANLKTKIMITAEEFFRNKIKEKNPNIEVVTLSRELITAEEGMRWAHEFKQLHLHAVNRRSEQLKAFIEWQKWDYKKPYDTPTDEIIKDYESL